MAKTYCMGCMRPINAGMEICPFCGRALDQDDQPPYALPLRAELNGGRYQVGCVLDTGSFGITYIGVEPETDRRLTIKEHYDRNRAEREEGGTALAWSLSMEDQAAGRERFVREARTAIQAGSIPNIVETVDSFFENGTAYIVSDYAEGTTLRDRISMGAMNYETCLATLRPLVLSLGMAHQQGLVHQDIGPDSILTGTEGTWLLDMGSPKELAAGDEASPESATAPLIRRGFSPPELYPGFTQAQGSDGGDAEGEGEPDLSNGEIGPWTDVYSLCATLYYCLTGGITPPESLDRAEKTAQIFYPREIPAAVLNVLEQGLSVSIRTRFQSMEALLEALEKAAEGELTPRAEDSTGLGDTEEADIPPTEDAPAPKKKAKKSKPPRKEKKKPKKDRESLFKRIKALIMRRKKLFTVVGIVLAVLLCGGGAYLGVNYIRSLPPPPPPLVYDVQDSAVTVVGFEKKPRSVTIPAEVEGKPVTRIAGKAFYECKSLRKVVIPEGVEIIDQAAFWGCEHLKRVSIPATVNGMGSVGRSAFYNCYSLTDIDYAGTDEDWHEAIRGSVNALPEQVIVHCAD